MDVTPDVKMLQKSSHFCMDVNLDVNLQEPTLAGRGAAPPCRMRMLQLQCTTALLHCSQPALQQHKTEHGAFSEHYFGGPCLSRRAEGDQRVRNHGQPELGSVLHVGIRGLVQLC